MNDKPLKLQKFEYYLDWVKKRDEEREIKRKRAKYISRKIQAQKPQNRIRRNQSKVIRLATKTDSNNRWNAIGCSPNEFQKHIESLWKPGMNWENYGNKPGFWVFDHKMPCRCFDLRIITERRKCNHYTNIQPLWYEENIEKGSKILF